MLVLLQLVSLKELTLAFWEEQAWTWQAFVMCVFGAHVPALAVNVNAHLHVNVAWEELEVFALGVTKRVSFLVEEAEMEVEEVVAMKSQMICVVHLASQDISLSSLSSLLVRFSCVCRLLL